jgi:hypothetical protein
VVDDNVDDVKALLAGEMDYLERGNSDKDTALHYAAKCTGNVETTGFMV